MNRKTKALCHTSASLLVLCLMTTAAQAQTEAAQETASATEDAQDNSLTIPEIIITAQKREQKLMDVSLAVTAVTGSEIEDKGYTNIADLLQRAPGVSVTSGSVQIRGISSLFGSATVGYYLDEIPFSFSISTILPDVRSWDLERVEVLRGPQGTLYGANSIGGTIRTLTKNPDLSSFEAKGEASVGSIKGGEEVWEVKGAVNLPIIEDRVALRVAATHGENGGYNDSPLGENINDQNNTTFRAKLALAPTDTTHITLSAWTSDTDTDNPVDTDRDHVGTIPLATSSALKYETYSGVIEQEAPGFNIVSASSYLHLASDNFSATFLAPGFAVPVTSSIDAKTFAQEIRLVSSGSGAFQWTAGGYYQHSKEDAATDIPGLYTDTNVSKSTAWALFGEAGYTLGALEVTAGLRYFHDKRTSDEVYVGSPLPTVEGTYDTFNPKFNLAWHASETSMFYGTISKGFRSGQNQPAVSAYLAALYGVDVPNQIDPETLWSYEVGNKTTLLDGKMTVEAALYYNDWRDLQVTVQATSIVGALVNAGKARAYGADLAITVRPIEGLSLTASGNINDSEFGSTVPTAFDKGDRIVNVPKYTFNASATYTATLTDSLSFFSFAELQQGGRRYLKAQGLSGQSDPQSLLNARVGVEGGNWGLYLTGTNLLNEDGFASVPLSSTNFEGTVPQPRTLGLLLRTNF